MRANHPVAVPRKALTLARSLRQELASLDLDRVGDMPTAPHTGSSEHLRDSPRIGAPHSLQVAVGEDKRAEGLQPNTLHLREREEMEIKLSGACLRLRAG